MRKSEKLKVLSAITGLKILEKQLEEAMKENPTLKSVYYGVRVERKQLEELDLEF